MEIVKEYTQMKSGDKFISITGPKVLYTLQKFPDFDLWMLISEHNAHWMKPKNTSFKAFGGSHYNFAKI